MFVVHFNYFKVKKCQNGYDGLRNFKNTLVHELNELFKGSIKCNSFVVTYEFQREH